MDKNGLYDIYGMMHIPWWQRPIFFWVISFFIFVIVVAIIIVIWRQLGVKKKVKSPWEQTIESLSAAYKAVIKQPQHADIFYSNLTTQLKRYFMAIYHVDLVGRTDAEFLAIMQAESMLPKEMLSLLAELLEHAITVKFAHGQALLDSIEMDYNRAIFIIKQTIPQENINK